MGAYGFLRFSVPMLPAATKTAVWIIGVLSIIGIVYGALVCMMQKDMKKLIAYSSVSHMGFVTLGIFALTPLGIAGSVLQQVNHGISTGALFLIVGVLYERRHTRLISEFGGLSTPMPNFAAIYMIITLSSLGLPLAEWLYRRIHHPAGRVRSEQAMGRVGRARHHPWRGVSAMALPARNVWSGNKSRERASAGSEPPRILHARAAGAPCVLDRSLSEAFVPVPG